jgi:hypothetical protein
MKPLVLAAVCVLFVASAADAQNVRTVEQDKAEFLKRQLEVAISKVKEVEIQTRKFREAHGASHGFSIILALGDLQGGTPARHLPEAASKALADMSEFLPYKSYELLDAQWILGSPRSTGHLRGPDNREFELELRTMPRSDTAVQIDFNLRDPSQASSPSAPRTPRLQGQALRVFKQPGRVIDTSFTMDVGETVVVGTSRLQGDKALIVLLTAVGK